MSVNETAIKHLEQLIATKRQEIERLNREISDLYVSVSALSLISELPEKRTRKRKENEQKENLQKESEQKQKENGNVEIPTVETITEYVTANPGVTRPQIKEHFCSTESPQFKEISQRINNLVNYLVRTEVLTRKGPGGSTDTYKARKNP